MDQPHPAAFASAQLVDEEERLRIVNDLGLRESADEAEYGTILRLAQQVTGCRIALISVVDRDCQWFKAQVRMSIADTAREHAFCAHAI